MSTSSGSASNQWSFRPQVHVLPYGIDDRCLRVPEQQAARQLLGIPNDRVIFLYCGRLSTHYKADLTPLIHAFRDVERTHGNCHLILAGSPDPTHYSAGLQRLVGELGLSGAVHIMENITAASKSILYGGSDIFISPVDNIQESHGIAILEAMAAGLPVICSDWSGYRELVDDGRTGYLVPTAIEPDAFLYADHLTAFSNSPMPESYVAMRTIVDVNMLTMRMNQLARSQTLRLTLGSNGKRLVASRYTWSSLISGFRDLWLDQSDEDVSSLQRGAIHLAPAFSTYASETLTPLLTFVTATEEGVKDISRTYMASDVGGRIVASCEGRIRSLHSLMVEFHYANCAIIYRLIKVGFLRIVGHASQHRSDIEAEESVDSASVLLASQDLQGLGS